MQAILERVHGKIFKGIKINVALLICNNPDAKGIERAKKFGLDTVIINHKDYASIDEFDKEVVDEINKYSIDLTILAGFMRILTPVFTDNIKAINLHPSILPLFKGAHAINDSFYSDMQVGVMGMVLGLPLFGVIYTLFAESTNRKLEERNISVEEINKVEEPIVIKEEVKK